MEYFEYCSATLIKGETFDKPQIMYGMSAGQIYTATQNVNFYLLFQSTAQVSGKFVFSIWFKSRPGSGSLQPTKVTLPVTEEEEEIQPDDGISFGPDIIEEEETTEDTTVPTTEPTGTNTNIKNVTNPFEIPVNKTIPIVQPSPNILPTNTSTTIIKNNINTTSTKGDSFDAKPEKAGESTKPDTPAEILKDLQDTKPNNTATSKPIFD